MRHVDGPDHDPSDANFSDLYLTSTTTCISFHINYDIEALGKLSIRKTHYSSGVFWHTVIAFYLLKSFEISAQNSFILNIL